MSHLLTKIRGNRLFNLTIWSPYIYIYDDVITYRKRNWFAVRENTISYNQIAQINIVNGIIFSELEIISTSNDVHTMDVRFINKKAAKKAKSIMDQKVRATHQKSNEEHASDKEIKNFEKSLARLKVLLDKGKINKREYNKKRKELLNKW